MRKNAVGNHSVLLRAKTIITGFPGLGDKEVVTTLNEQHHSRNWIKAVVGRARRELQEEKAFLSERTGV